MQLKQVIVALFVVLAMRISVAAVYFVPKNFSDLPGWTSPAIDTTTLQALKASCQRNSNFFSYYFQTSGDVRGELPWMISCQGVLSLPQNASAQQVRHTLEHYFQPYLVIQNHSNIGLFTGYYLPEIPGSLEKTKYYSLPIYGMPKKTWDLPPRDEINQRDSLPNTPVLAWIHNPVDLYFMQVQGSGRIQLPDGQVLLLGYAGQNGYPYYPIGRLLRDIGVIKPDRLSSETLEAWLNTHPKLGRLIMDVDPSYVFFKVLETQQPLGAEKIALSPQVSLAVDPRYIPLGTALWLSTYYPMVDKEGRITPGPELQHLLIAQDTGGAIKGPIRGDIYWGSGDRAKFLASHLQSEGQYWALLPQGLNVGILNDRSSEAEIGY